ncbi:hypothetical protein N8I77_005286 [Diaporthe amygdali]|uniref:Uncharacterized protein n=1 Tax=Phomopsis amygdali TaxID=1214568 RepID=A0AAD9SFE1_PHOAM|nr:hypothetical protein N8I77_005286 [Diaporthe amygdali]
MISACHEALIQSYTALINDWLNLVKAGSVESDGRRCSTATSRVTKSVRGTGSAAIEFGSRKGTYGPDQSYTFEDADFPSLVLEIAWSQTDDDLRRKARNYITWSKGAVRTVIAVSLNDIYTRIDNLSKTRKIREEDLNRGAAKFFIYRSDLSTARTGEVLPGEDQLIRDVTGNLVPGTELRLSLEDFIPADEARETDGLENPELIVTAEQLLDDTKYALRRQWRSMNKRKVTGTSPSPVAEARRHFPRMSRELKSLGSAIIPSRLRSGRL